MFKILSEKTLYKIRRKISKIEFQDIFIIFKYTGCPILGLPLKGGTSKGLRTSQQPTTGNVIVLW